MTRVPWLVLAAGSLLLPALSLSQEGFPLFTMDFPPEEFAARRAAVFDAIGKNAFAVVQGAPNPPGYVRFRQSNEFYYLSGIETPHAYLLLDGAKRKATLYLPHRHEDREKGEGRGNDPQGDEARGARDLGEHAFHQAGTVRARARRRR